MGSIDRRIMVVVACAVVVGISAVVIAKKEIRLLSIIRFAKL